MDFDVSADPPHVVDFRKEVAAWMDEQFKGHEHLRWSASWSTREDKDARGNGTANMIRSRTQTNTVHRVAGSAYRSDVAGRTNAVRTPEERP